MIKKIELKIFLIIFVLLSIMIGAFILYNAYSSYNSTVRGIASYVERIYNDKRSTERDIEGFYAVKVMGHKITDDKEFPNEIKEYVEKITYKKSDSGIIGDYIYKSRNRGGIDKRRRNNYIA